MNALNADPVRYDSRRKHSMLREWLLCAVLLSGFVAAAASLEWFVPLDKTLYDTGMLMLRRPAPANIAIVAIDQASLDRIGRWPWRRAVHGALLDRLTEAQAGPVGIDLLLSESDRADPGGDETLAAAIRRHGRVALPVVMEVEPGVGARPVLPAPGLASATAALAHVHVELDRDGVARSVFLREGLHGEARSHMSLALMEIAGRMTTNALPGARRDLQGGTAAPSAAGSWIRDHWVHVAFRGPPGHFQNYSYVDVLLGKVAAAELKDKYVLVGSTAPGLLDAYPTPVSGFGRAMPGVEIMANVLAGLMEERFVRVASRWEAGLLAAVLVLALLGSYLFLTPRRALIASVLAVAGSLAGAFVLLVVAGWWVPPSSALAGLIACYPAWSWRRLEATQRQMEDELARFASEPELLGSAAFTRESDRMGDVIEQRIGQVRRATRQLRDARRFVADTLNGIPVGALVVDSALRTVLANSKASDLLGERSLAGRGLADVLASIDVRPLLPWATLLARAPLGFESVHGSGRDLLINVVPFERSTQERGGLLVSLVDISELKAADREREQALGFVSHDLRSPLASIVALLDVAALAPAAAPKDLNERIRRYVERSLTLSDDFVQLARAGSMKSESFAPVDLVAVVRAALEEQSVLAQKKDMRITLAEGPQSALTSGVGDVLQRVFVNLLGNAIKYCPPATPVVCTIRREGGQWVIAVVDEGPGIAPDQLPRIFGRFERVGAEKRASGPGGAGLGLAFVKTAAEKHGGAVEVNSEQGKGSQFIVRLPVLAISADAVQ